MKMRRLMLLLFVASAAAVMAQSQSLADPGDASSTVASAAPAEPLASYVRPTEKTRLRNYFFDAFGPYPIIGAAFGAGLSQAGNTPPDWEQGATGYGKRFGSDFGIAAVTTTARYGLARAFREDTLYYRCECKGLFPRLSHAVVSSFTSRRGDDGHRVFSFPALIAPYAGTFTAVYGWYPDRYGAKDALRMGNYSLLGSIGGNLGLEFIYGGPHSLLSRMHLEHAHKAPSPGPKP